MDKSLAPRADRAYFAAFLDLRGTRGIVVGGGPVAALKAEVLLRSAVTVTVIAPDLCNRLTELVLLGAVNHEAKRFQPGDLVGAAIAIAATDDPSVNEAVSSAARALHIPVNVADNAAGLRVEDSTAPLTDTTIRNNHATVLRAAAAYEAAVPGIGRPPLA